MGQSGVPARGVGRINLQDEASEFDQRVEQINGLQPHFSRKARIRINPVIMNNKVRWPGMHAPGGKDLLTNLTEPVHVCHPIPKKEQVDNVAEPIIDPMLRVWSGYGMDLLRNMLEN